MTRTLKLSLLAALLAACAPTPPATPEPGPGAAEAVEPGPFSVIFFVGDGTGLNYWSAARMAFPDVAVEHFPVIGLMGTEPTNNRITDSAAGATAFASGIKTYNGAIGVGPDTTPARTVLEMARDEGKATGLVVTSTINHATPAAFAAHVPNRNMYFQIAAQMADENVDVMIGGGRQFFDPHVRPDSVDLLARLARRATVVQSESALADLDLSTVRRLVAFTADGQPPEAARRTLSQSRTTQMALDILSRDPDGFFLMVEGSQIDWRGHENAPIGAVLAELQDLNGAIHTALEFQRQHPNTLIVVTADHETGGMALHYDSLGVFGAHYTTGGHTAGMVPLFARGPGAERFAGIKENDEVGRTFMDLIRKDGPTLAP